MDSGDSLRFFQSILSCFEGEFFSDNLRRTIYSTDASEFQEKPLAVAIPRSENDIQRLIAFAREKKIGLIPRAAGTSLAGQVVGNGIVVDTGKYLNKIVSIDPVQRRVVVQPGVVRNELNLVLASHGLFFAPETSTANRAMIGGMVGNNSCGANSIAYGSTREHLVRVRGFLSDGSEVEFYPLGPAEFAKKCAGGGTLESEIYRGIRELLSDVGRRAVIRENFPKKEVTRRNTGYALDLLMDAEVFGGEAGKEFNFCRLLAGSEGTLFFGVEYELQCVAVPPPAVLLCAHFRDIAEALQANLVALKYRPTASELIDKHILDCTKKNIEQRKNRFFVQGDPGAILVIEFREGTVGEGEATAQRLAEELAGEGRGYAFPILSGGDVGRVWELRRAGQGVMTNVTGDTRPAEVVEDTAVAVEDLPAYIGEFAGLMREKYGIACVYYAHAGSGELHTRPMINLKTEEGHAMFRSIATDIAALVKKYRGSLSGEHGDGRLRGEFIRFMVGDECYGMMEKVKELFDPSGIFNPGKITATPPMDAFHRYGAGHPTPEYETYFDFSDVLGVLRAAEKCNGSGDCRKTEKSGGTMCPSYMATRDEKDTTRARANVLRHLLTNPPDPKRPFLSEEAKQVLDLCLSCKGCKSECPSNVDMAKLKAEFLQNCYDVCGVPLRTWMIAHFASVARLFSRVPQVWNFVFSNSVLRGVANRLVSFHPSRSIPLLNRMTFRKWFFFRKVERKNSKNGKRVYFFCDEFTDANDFQVGVAAVELLEGLGYEVELPPHGESGRAALSKGMLRKARQAAKKNVHLLGSVVGEDSPLVGVEPSAILCFRDEYPDLLRGEEKERAKKLAKNCWMIDEFLDQEREAGRVSREQFVSGEKRVIHLHGHCQQKALGSLAATVRLLALPEGNEVKVIPSGCCGMAGSFGYEVEHYEVSQKIGELVLFPYVRKVLSGEVIAATGTSCRHQVLDGTGRQAIHPVEILAASLKWEK